MKTDDSIYSRHRFCIIISIWKQKVNRSSNPRSSSCCDDDRYIFNGWTGRVNDPAQADNLVRIYGKLWQTTEFLKTIEILTFSELANTYYQNLILESKNLAKKRLEKDMRIAAIALSVGGTIVTRNQKDFDRFPGLKIEDWAL